MGKALDLAGKVFGNLTVLTPDTSDIYRRWLCRCKCGTELLIKSGSLNAGYNKGCGKLSCRPKQKSRKLSQSNKPEPEYYKEIIGKQFGHLECLGRSDKVFNRKDGKIYKLFKFKCRCGKEIDLPPGRVKIGLKKSCGCVKAQDSHTIKPSSYFNEAAYNRIYGNYKRNAELNFRDFTIELEKFIQLVSSDCYYCGDKPSRPKYSGNNKEKYVLYNGLDRVDSNNGYTLDNVVTCCFPCNQMKRDYTVEIFFARINKIAQLHCGDK